MGCGGWIWVEVVVGVVRQESIRYGHETEIDDDESVQDLRYPSVARRLCQNSEVAFHRQP